MNDVNKLLFSISTININIIENNVSVQDFYYLFEECE